MPGGYPARSAGRSDRGRLLDPPVHRQHVRRRRVDADLGELLADANLDDGGPVSGRPCALRRAGRWRDAARRRRRRAGTARGRRGSGTWRRPRAPRCASTTRRRRPAARSGCRPPCRRAGCRCAGRSRRADRRRCRRRPCCAARRPRPARRGGRRRRAPRAGRRCRSTRSRPAATGSSSAVARSARPGPDRRRRATATCWDAHPEQQRRPVARAGIRQPARAGIEDRDDDRDLPAAELRGEDVAADVQGRPRGQAGLEVGAKVEAHERGERDGVAPVARDIADDDGRPAPGQVERVVEVPAGREAVGGHVRGGHARAGDSLRQDRQERGLQDADVLEQQLALALDEAPSPRLRDGDRAGEQPEAREDAERDPQLERDDVEHADDRARDRGDRRRVRVRVVLGRRALRGGGVGRGRRRGRLRLRRRRRGPDGRDPRRRGSAAGRRCAGRLDVSLAGRAAAGVAAGTAGTAGAGVTSAAGAAAATATSCSSEVPALSWLVCDGCAGVEGVGRAAFGSRGARPDPPEEFDEFDEELAAFEAPAPLDFAASDPFPRDEPRVDGAGAAGITGAATASGATGAARTASATTARFSNAWPRCSDWPRPLSFPLPSDASAGATPNAPTARTRAIANRPRRTPLAAEVLLPSVGRCEFTAS